MTTGLDTVIGRGVERLAGCLSPDGLWRDFRTAVGESDEWVSGLALAYLASVPEAEDLRKGVLPALVRRRRADGGWGYNARVASDCDSTCWGVLAGAARLGADGAEGSEEGVAAQGGATGDAACALIQAHETPEGGFSTYRASLRPRRPELRREWFEPQPCVTAAAVLALMSGGLPPTHPAIARALDRLESREADGWRSTWWPGPAYTAHLAREALVRGGREPRRATAEPPPVDVVFERAHALLLRLPAASPDEVRAAAAWLLDRQQADGSWPSAPILRIPDDTPGVVRLSDDQNRTFATVAALRALSAVRGRPGAA